MRRLFHLLALVMVIAFALTACTSGATTPPAAPTAAPAPTAPPAAQSAQTKAATTPASTAQTVKEVVVGAVHPLTGALAQDGAFLKNGIDLAVEEINGAGGIKALGGAKLVIKHADSQGKPEVGQSETERLIGEGMTALIGTYQSAVTLNATQVAEREKVPFIVDVTVANQILERGFNYTFRIQPDQTQMTLGLVEALPDLRSISGLPVKKVVTLHEDSIFGTGFVDILKNIAPQHNLELLGDVSYSVKGLTDLTTELSRAQALNPDIIVATGYLNDGILLARTAKDLQIKAPIIGLANGAFSTQQFVDQVGKIGEYFMDANYHYDATKAKAREVRDRYKAKFGTDMPTHGVMAYEAVYVLKDALERCGSTDRAKVRNALAATKLADHILPYQGAIEFDEKGQAKNARSVLMQIQDGKILQVAPAALAEAKPVFPPPPWSQR